MSTKSPDLNDLQANYVPVGRLENYNGDEINAHAVDGRYYWSLESHSTLLVQEITPELHAALVAFGRGPKPVLL